jgi:hypothetical protein
MLKEKELALKTAIRRAMVERRQRAVEDYVQIVKGPGRFLGRLTREVKVIVLSRLMGLY